VDDPVRTHPVRAIVAGHGTFAEGLISAVHQITGHGDMFAPMTNTGLCADDIMQTLSRALDDTGAKVIFTDLPAGSCTMAVRRLLRGRTGVVLITGSNVPMLLDFAMQESVDAVEAAHATVERARTAIALHASTS
jgi:PTS system N-acetylgalactosamine-specific IIA component